MLFATLLSAVVAVGPVTMDTDTTFAAGDASRLDVESMGGEVVVHGWDRDEIRVVAEHSSRTLVEIRRSGRTVFIEPEGRSFPTVVDFEVWVPRAMDVSLEGFQSSLSVDGTSGEIEAETFQGSVSIEGGSGTVQATSVSGRVTIRGASGEVIAEATSGSIVISDSSGEIEAESVGGSILMENMAATRVDAETVGGRVEYSGSLAPGGDYYFGTHSGRVVLELPRDAEAELRLTTLSGNVSVDHPGAAIERASRGRSSVRLGNGGSRVEVESFSGRILVRESGRR